MRGILCLKILLLGGKGENVAQFSTLSLPGVAHLTSVIQIV